MNEKIQKMISSMVDENAVVFKEATQGALYEKVNKRLQEKYQEVAKTIVKGNNETNNRTN
jgi:hypothetical protein